MGSSLKSWKPKKKPTWNYLEVPEDPSVSELMPGFEIQYMITGDTVENNDLATFGHCVFPPNSAHDKHLHTKAGEIVYVIKGKLMAGYTSTEGDVETVCSEGTAAYAGPNVWHWVRNPFKEPVEFVFGYFGANGVETSGYKDWDPEKDEE